MANHNSPGKCSKIAHNIWYLCVHKHPGEIQVTIALYDKENKTPDGMALFQQLRPRQTAHMNS